MNNISLTQTKTTQFVFPVKVCEYRFLEKYFFNANQNHPVCLSDEGGISAKYFPKVYDAVCEDCFASLLSINVLIPLE